MSIGTLLLVSLGTLGGGLQDPVEGVRRARDEGRYAEALERTADIPDPAQRAFERLEVRYCAGDLGGALREALTGLEDAPDHRMLLWRGSRLAVDLRATERAVRMSERLRAGVEADADLAPADREAWVKAASELAQAATALERTDTRRANALWRARASVVVVALGVLLAAGWLSRSPRRAASVDEPG